MVESARAGSAGGAAYEQLLGGPITEAGAGTDRHIGIGARTNAVPTSSWGPHSLRRS